MGGGTYRNGDSAHDLAEKLHYWRYWQGGWELEDWWAAWMRV